MRWLSLLALQARTPGLLRKPTKTLLDQALIEGIADFVGELASGTNFNEWLRAYAIPREAALWDEFKLDGRDGRESLALQPG